MELPSESRQDLRAEPGLMALELVTKMLAKDPATILHIFFHILREHIAVRRSVEILDLVVELEGICDCWPMGTLRSKLNGQN